MSRKLILSAMLVAGSLFAVGCGAVSEATKKGADAAKDAGKEVGDKAKEAAEKAGDKAKEVGDLAAKLKETAEGYTKDTGMLEKAIAALGEAKKKAGDAAEGLKLGKIENEATGLFGDLKKKIGDLAGLKDLASLDGAKKAIGEIIEKLKGLLKDYMPKG